MEPPSLKRQRASLEGAFISFDARSGGLIRAISGATFTSKLWKDHLRSLAAALPAERRVSARRGWAREISALFEHPVRLRHGR